MLFPGKPSIWSNKLNSVIHNKNINAMKKLMMITAIFSLTLLSAFAQRDMERKEISPEQRAERSSERLAEKLDLSEEQKKQVYELNLQTAEARKAQMEARRTEMKQNREAHQAKMEVILSPEQQEKWNELRESNRKRGGEMRKGEENRRKQFRKGGSHKKGSASSPRGRYGRGR
jgi:protein CpxP